MDRKTACVEQVGKVVGVAGDKVRVLIMAQSACAGCHAKGVCGMSETEPREVELQANGEDYQVNDTARVQIASRQGLKAVLLGYMIPFALVLSLLFGLRGIGLTEGLAALVGIAFLVPYYLLLYLLRGRLNREFGFVLAGKI